MKRIMSILLIGVILCTTSFYTDAKSEDLTEELENKLNKEHENELRDLKTYIDIMGDEIISYLMGPGINEFQPSYFKLEEATKLYSDSLINSENGYSDVSLITDLAKKGADGWIVPVYDINDELSTYVTFRKGITEEQAIKLDRWWPDEVQKEKYFSNIKKNSGKWEFKLAAIAPSKDILTKYSVLFDKSDLANILIDNGIDKVKSISYIELTLDELYIIEIETNKEKVYYIISANYTEKLEDSKIYDQATFLGELQKSIDFRDEYANINDIQAGGGLFNHEKSKVIGNTLIITGCLLLVFLVAYTLIKKKNRTT